MKTWNYVVKHWKVNVLFLTSLTLLACAQKHKDAFVYPDMPQHQINAKEVKTPLLKTSGILPPPSMVSDVSKKEGFVPPPLSPQFSREEAETAKKKAKRVDAAFAYKDKKLKELLPTFPFMRIKKLSRIEYLQHDMEMIKESLFSQPTTLKQFIGLNVLKESYIFYTKKNKMYRKISKKIAKREKVSQKQSEFIKIVNQMYFILRNVLINEEADYRLKTNAIRYMEAMKGGIALDFFIKDALEDIVSSKEAPPSLVAKAKAILEKNKK